MTQLISVHPTQPEKDKIAVAAKALRAGQLVAFPTETVYGLGADATNDNAVAAIFAAKNRPDFNPLISHFAHSDQIHDYVVADSRAGECITAFWPGPLTLVLPRRPASKISLLCSAGMDCLAVRMPLHPVARALLQEAQIPIAAPSANRSGKISATTPLHVMEELDGRIDIVLGAGRCEIGLESTVLDLTKTIPRLLRHGGITVEQIESVIGKIEAADLLKNADSQPLSPGQMQSHYAPHALVRLNANHAEADEALLTFGPDFGIKGGVFRYNLSPKGDLNEAAANLFSMLRACDKPEISSIAVTPIPEKNLGLAINDRLRRAAAPRIHSTDKA